MKKVSRALLVAAGAMLALVAVMLLAVNLYVQGQGTQARIQHELSQRLGTTLVIQRMSVTPWSGLKLTGITMPQERGVAGPEFLRAETFRLRIRFLSLFERRLVITEVSLIQPSVVWAQNASGKWRLPGTEPPPVARVAETAAPASGRAPASPEAPAVARVPETRSAATPPSAPAESEEVTSAPFTPEVRRVTLANGSFHFLDEKQKPVATFERVNFRSTLRNGSALRGNASIGKVSLRDRFFLEQLESPIRYDGTALGLTKITAQAAGGAVDGSFQMNPADPDSPFHVAVKFHDLQADQLVTNAGGPAGMMQGRLEGQLTAAGKTADAHALAGAGEIYLRDGQVRQYSLLMAVGEVLRIDELKQLRFDQAQAKYHIAPGTVTVDELLLTSANIRLSAVGTIGFDGKLRLDSQLAISEKIRGQLFRAIRDNFEPSPEAGYSFVSFRVTGTVDRPKTNLMERLVGGEMKDLGGLLNSFLGGGDKASKKKKQPAAEPPQPTLDSSVFPSPPQPEQSAAPPPPPSTETP